MMTQELKIFIYSFVNYHIYTVKDENRKFVINRMSITVFQEQEPASIIWDDAGAEYAVNSAGAFTSREAWGPLEGWG